jgi:hypothetical protein
MIFSLKEMNNKIKEILKTSTLILSWIVFSPLFLFLSAEWKRPKLIGRIMLTIIAPVTLLTLSFVTWHGYEYYYYQVKRGSRSEIEAKTGIDFPEYKTIEKRRRAYEPSFNGDFTMNYSVQLDTTDIDQFYKHIREAISYKNVVKNDSLYFYWDIDFNGNFFFNHNDFQENLDLQINNKTGEMKITYGSM